VKSYCENGNEPSGSIKCLGNSWVVERLAASQEGLSSMKLGICRCWFNKTPVIWGDHNLVTWLSEAPSCIQNKYHRNSNKISLPNLGSWAHLVMRILSETDSLSAPSPSQICNYSLFFLSKLGYPDIIYIVPAIDRQLICAVLTVWATLTRHGYM
jgi:hypothetical protein